VPIDSLAQRTVYEDASRIALRLPVGEALASLHPGGCFPLVVDPRSGDRACIVGMMVLRPAAAAWTPSLVGESLPDAMRAVEDWCFDVAGVGGSWPLSGGNVVDAYRLALQYGTVDAVMAGASTVRREGIAEGSRRAHLWQPYAPLSWPVLRPHRHLLEPAIVALRRDWQELGLLSTRRHAAQIAVSASGRAIEGGRDLLDASIFRDRHPDGSPIEARVLTSESGAERLREGAKAKGRRIDDLLLVVSPPGDPAAVDLAAVPALLRQRLDLRLVEHDGGATSLAAFLDAGAVAQLNLTLMRGRSVREVLERSSRIDDATRVGVLGDWPRAARLFPRGGGALPERWPPFYAVAEVADGGEALVVSLDVRAG